VPPAEGQPPLPSPPPPPASTTEAPPHAQREDMEDDGAIHQVGDFTYAAVFDGHGGDAAAHYMARELHKSFAPYVDVLSSASPSEGPANERGLHCPPALYDGMQELFAGADREVIEWLKKNIDPEAAKEAGCTATVLLARADKLICANLGDSRCVMSRNGVAQDLSAEHRLYGPGLEVEDEVARVEASGGWVEDGRLCGIIAVARAFGDWEWKGEGLDYIKGAGVEWGCWDEATARNMKFSSDPVIASPAVSVLEVDPETDEFVMLASDGLWDVFTSEQAVQFARQLFQRGMDAQKVAETLVDKALQRKSEDNVICAVVDLKGPEGWRGSKKKLFGMF